MRENKEFKPYISAQTIAPELTFVSMFIGIVLAIVFGAANAYLGLRVGMTVSASIPAAVLGMGTIRFVAAFITRKTSVLETNMIQTIGSAGESLAAGAIFTMPALFLWAAEGKGAMPTILEITLIALFGGILGVLFMVPLRQALIVQEHGVLPYPEGMACSEVILAGEKGGSGAKSVFIGLGIGALLKFIVDGICIVKSTAVITIQKIHGEISTEVYPALIGVGYICGFKISSYMFAGGILGWLVLIPAIYLFGQDAVLFPGDISIAKMWADGGASAIWGSYVRYIGAGAIATGGILSLIKSLPLIIRTFKGAMVGLKDSRGAGTDVRTDQDIKLPVILGGILIIVILIAAVPAIPVNVLGALLIVVFGFFFATVSSRMVGLVGSSNNPVSGMAIATLLVSTIALKASGQTGIAGMTGSIAIGSVICIIAAIAGDTSQDLKTGFILGATPRKQQIGELVGAVVSAIAIGGILYLFNSVWTFGSAKIPAPQANLMKMIVEGVMDGNLPWTLVFIGVFIALLIEILGVPVMPFAIGLYLPIELSACIMIGGVVRWVLERKKYRNEDHKTKVINGGILCCSGMIAGEGLVGVILAILAGFKLNISLADYVNLGQIGGLAVLALGVLTVLKFSLWDKEANA